MRWNFFEVTGKWNDFFSLWIVLEPLSPLIYNVVCLYTRAMACIYVSAYVAGLGSGTPEYTQWNVKCVFWAARGQGMSPKLTVNILRAWPHRVCVLWVTAGDGHRPETCCLPPHIFTHTNTLTNQTHAHTHVEQPICPFHGVGVMYVF